MKSLFSLNCCSSLAAENKKFDLNFDEQNSDDSKSKRIQNENRENEHSTVKQSLLNGSSKDKNQGDSNRDMRSAIINKALKSLNKQNQKNEI